MIKHVTIFTIDPERGAEGVAQMKAALDEAAAASPLVRASESGTMLPPIPGAPEPPEGAGPAWGDVVQILTFDNREDADAYPASPAHDVLLAKSEGLVVAATAIDFEA